MVVQLRHATAGEVVAGHEELVYIVTPAEHLYKHKTAQMMHSTRSFNLKAYETLIYNAHNVKSL